jgi:uncharacterized YigZ family protein
MPKIQFDIENTIEIKKSKFITYLHRTSDEEEAKEYIRQIKKMHPNATHHCTAMIIGSIMRSNDDGEPSQTAGHPMLNVLMQKEMQDILVVVVRYFGGIKLGTGGLVRAYSSSVSEALDKSVLVEETMFDEYEIEFNYSLIGKLDHYFATHGIHISLKDYALANLIGKFPSTALEVVIGHDVVNYKNNLDRLMIVIVLVCIIYGAIWYYNRRKERKTA